MARIDIISGFLGAGKTTLIKKLLNDSMKNEKVVLIENEFGEIGIDGGFLKDAGIEITEMNSGCICCSLVGDFGKALAKVMETYSPDRIIIEPSGVGKLSDVIKAVAGVEVGMDTSVINSASTVVDATKAKIYMKNFGEFFNNQVESAKTIILSRTQNLTEEKLLAVVGMLKEKNPDAVIITTPWDEIDGNVILRAMEQKSTLASELIAALKDDEDEHEHHHHHDHEHDHDHDHEHHHHDHDDDDHDHEHEHHHHHHDDDDFDECGHDHHHHDHDHEHHHDHDHDHDHEHHHEHDHDHEHEHEHHHHHEDGEECSCGCGHHHHHHDADEVFTSWGKETPHKYTKEKLKNILDALAETTDYGTILRSKGMVCLEDGSWAYFDLVPGEVEIRTGMPDYTGRLCVIGKDLKEDELAKLFEI